MRSVYFIGIGGSGMEPLARFARAQGLEVGGSDRALTKERQASLAKAAILAGDKPDPKCLGSYDVIVYSNAIAKDHPERQAALNLPGQNQQTKLMHRMDFLNICLSECKGRFAVAGTHGKTSSTAMLGWLLLELGLDPHIIVGGRPLHLSSGARVGSGQIGICETDESDGSFLQSQAQFRLVLNLDHDHLDYYGSFTKLCQAFHNFCLDPHTKRLVINVSDPNLNDIAKDPQIQPYCTTFAYFNNADTMHRFVFDEQRASSLCQYSGYFDQQSDSLRVFRKSSHLVFQSKDPQDPKKLAELEDLGTLQLQIPGRHFAANALGVLALAIESHLYMQQHIFSDQSKWDGNASKAITALNAFRGTERRIEKIGEYQEVQIYDDYGHHPTEIRAVLSALRLRLPSNKRLVAIFQPHRYSRTAALASAFAQALCLADEVFLLPIYAAGERQRPGVASELISRDIVQTGHPCHLLKADQERMIVHEIKQVIINCRSGDVLVSLGAGSISRLIRQSLANISKE